MIVRLLFLQILVWTFPQGTIQAQNLKHQFRADSIFIYKKYSQCGTTARLWHNHRELDSLRNEKTKLNPDELKTFNGLISSIKNRKLFQQKYGGEICYMIIYQNGEKNIFVTYISKDYCLLDDLNKMRRWKIVDSKDIEKFYDLTNKNWR